MFAGYAVLGLAALGLIAYRRRAALWAVAALVFALLALGPVLHVGGQTQFAGIGPIPLPYALLVRLIPVLRISRSVSRFDVVVMLALAMLAAMAAAWLLRRLGSIGRVSPPAVLVALALLGVIGLEYLAAPYPYPFLRRGPFTSGWRGSRASLPSWTCRWTAGIAPPTCSTRPCTRRRSSQPTHRAATPWRRRGGRRCCRPSDTWDRHQ